MVPPCPDPCTGGAGDHDFDAKRDEIELVSARVPETLVAPYYLDFDRGVIVLPKGRQKSVGGVSKSCWRDGLKRAAA